MSYADECLKRASAATSGPWNNVYGEYRDCHGYAMVVLSPDIEDKWATMEDLQFMSHSRTDVVELAQRLKIACDMLRGLPIVKCKQLADELERMPE